MSRFHRAIGVITIVASAIFLLCIMLLKVDERRRDVAALRLMGISRARSSAAWCSRRRPIAVLGSVVGVGVGVRRVVDRQPPLPGACTARRCASRIVTGDIVLLAVALSLVLGIVAGWLAARRLVRTPPLALFGR